MVTFELTAESVLERPLPDVFAFFADARNLGVITPPWLRFELHTRGPSQMTAGTLNDYRLRLRGGPLSWRSEISVWQPPRWFVDEQRRRPYRVWAHEHTFESGSSGTVARDRMRYAVPGGALAKRLFVAPDLLKIVTFRQETLTRVFGGHFTPVKIRCFPRDDGADS
jgi:ligand-binding SRPBCC domain-containing protein